MRRRGRIRDILFNLKGAAIIYFAATYGINYGFHTQERENDKAAISVLEEMTEDEAFAKKLAKSNIEKTNSPSHKLRKTNELLHYVDILTYFFE